MNALCEKYIQNLTECDQIQNRMIPEDCTEEELLTGLHNDSQEKRMIRKEQDTILDSCLGVFERGEEQVTPEKAQELEEFAKALARRSGSIDSPISYRVHHILLDYFRSAGNINKFIEHMYGCGLCEWYANRTNLGVNKCRHFTEAMQYLDRYDQMDEEGRRFLERCLTNHILNFTNRDPDRLLSEGEWILREMDHIVERYGHMAGDEKMLRSAVYRNMLTACEMFRQHIGATPENRQKVYEYAEKAYEEIQTTKDRDVSILAQYPNYYYAAFHAGKITLDQLLSILENIMTEDPSLSRQANCLRVFSNTSGYLKYLWIYSEKSREEINRISQEKVNAAMRYTELLKKDEQSSVVSRYLANMIYSLFLALPYNQAIRETIHLTICQHKPTCIHTIVVSRLCEEILELVFHDCPEQLAGVGGYQADEILLHREEIMRFMKQGAILHDVGKYTCFDMISNMSRRLEDMEFEHIKQHPVKGYEYVTNTEIPGAVSDCVLRHHLWHNGKGGYPSGLSETDHQPLVDILSIADSLDAATDWFGRTYAQPKSIADLICEFNETRDTRYAGFVIDVISTPEGLERMNHVLNEERREITCQVWLDRDGTEVSKRVTEQLSII